MEKDTGNFFFAITAINIIFFLKKYFHLADFLVPGRDSEDYCNRRALKNFSRVFTNDGTFLKMIHEKLLLYFYDNIWLPAQKKHADTLLQFNNLFEVLQKYVRQTF